MKQAREPLPKQQKRLYIVIASVFVLLLLTLAFDAVKAVILKRVFAKPHAYVMTVSAEPASMLSWQPEISAVGEMVASNAVDVNPRTAGQVTQILFRSGQRVNKGDVLVQLDDALDQQSLKVKAAQLHTNQANYDRLKSVYARSNGTSKQNLDSAKSTLLQSQAEFAAAQLNIEYKKIRAPFSGQLGIRQINVGQFLQAGAAVVSLQKLDPIFVDFSLPERDYHQLEIDQQVAVAVQDKQSTRYYGRISAISPAVDASTKTFSVRALMKNTDLALLPGQFANVSVLLPWHAPAVTVPITAINYSLFGNTVYVLSPKPPEPKVQPTGVARILGVLFHRKKSAPESSEPVYVAKWHNVTLGSRLGARVVLLDGVKNNELVVTSGQLKIHGGSLVRINNSITPYKKN